MTELHDFSSGNRYILDVANIGTITEGQSASIRSFTSAEAAPIDADTKHKKKQFLY